MGGGCTYKCWLRHSILLNCATLAHITYYDVFWVLTDLTMSPAEAWGTLANVVWRVHGLLTGSSVVALGHVAVCKGQTERRLVSHTSSSSSEQQQFEQSEYDRLFMSCYTELEKWVGVFRKSLCFCGSFGLFCVKANITTRGFFF